MFAPRIGNHLTDRLRQPLWLPAPADHDIFGILPCRVSHADEEREVIEEHPALTKPLCIRLDPHAPDRSRLEAPRPHDRNVIALCQMRAGYPEQKERIVCGVLSNRESRNLLQRHRVVVLLRRALLTLLRSHHEFPRHIRRQTAEVLLWLPIKKHGAARRLQHIADASTLAPAPASALETSSQDHRGSAVFFRRAAGRRRAPSATALPARNPCTSTSVTPVNISIVRWHLSDDTGFSFRARSVGRETSSRATS